MITNAVLFWLFSAVAGFSALGVVLTRNIVRTAVCLMFTLTAVAGLYFLLDAEFLAAAQLVVYVGGTLILIVFGVMLTSKSPFVRFEPRLVEVVLAVSVGTLVLATLVLALTRQPFADRSMVAAEGYPLARLGIELMGEYLVPFEVISLLLLVVMIGAAYLARTRRSAARTSVMSERPEASKL